MPKPYVVTFGEETGSKRSARIPEGDYGFKVKSGELGKSKQKKSPQMSLQVVVSQDPTHEGKYEGKMLYDNFILTENSLWKVRQFLESIGVTVKTNKRMALDPKLYKKQEFGGTVADDEYEGKTKSQIVDHYPIEELEDRVAGVAVDLDEDEEDDDEEDEDEDEDEETEDDDEDVDDEDEEEDDEEEDEDDEEEDEDEEEPEPPKKSKPKSSKKAPASGKKSGKGVKGKKRSKQLEEIDLDSV